MQQIKIQCFQHVPYEGLACIEDWIKRNEYAVSFTRFYEHYSLPELGFFDWLIIMGGPMGVSDESQYPWLKEEKEFIKKAVEQDKTVIGICLGAQLIAASIGARVYPNKHKEIGWFSIENPSGSNLAESVYNIPVSLKVFHWHGDTFDLPEGSVHLFSSPACKNQGFLFKDNVLGLQFHFEATPQSVSEMVENGADELLQASEFVQSKEVISEEKSCYEASNKRMFDILDELAKKKNYENQKSHACRDIDMHCSNITGTDICTQL